MATHHAGRSRHVALLFLSGLLLLSAAGHSAVDPTEMGAKPTLLLNPTGLADEVDPGDIFATLGDVAIFWLDELEDRGTPDSPFDDTVRLALWRTDGSEAGTYALLPPEVSLLFYLHILDDTLFFVVCRNRRPIEAFWALCDSDENVELWRTDGTVEGTFRLLEEGQGHVPARGTSTTLAAPPLGRFFFVTTDAGSGEKLWATDGTREGTLVVKDLSRLGLQSPSNLVVWGEEVYFSAVKPLEDHYRLWIGRTDGTTLGTSFSPAEIDRVGLVEAFVVAGEHLFLVMTGPEKEPHPVSGHLFYRRTLWAMERGSEEFRRLADLGLRKTGSRVQAWVGLERVFLEIPELGGEATEIWASDGELSGTMRLGRAPRATVQGHVWTEPLRLSAGHVLVALANERYGLEPWITDESAGETELLLDLCPGECSSFPVGAAALGDWYYFSAEDESRGRELWRWKPTEGTVEQVADLCPGECGGYPIVADKRNEILFLRVIDSQLRRHIWQLSLDGSVQEVTDFGDLRLGGFELLFGRGVYSWKIVGNRAVFWATDAADRLGLWAMDVPSAKTLPPADPGLTSDELPGFSVKVRITSGSGTRVVGRAEANCIPETLCVSGALPGRSEVFVRVVGPKPNGRLWPTLVKFTTSTVEVWIEQLSTGIVRYYRLEGATPGSSELPGLFDRDGFSPIPE